ncbi:MAG: methionine aminopeptidase [Canibacter sp.]
MPNEDWGVTDPEAQYYYNSVTGEVEQGKQSNSLDRIGPFSTRAEAARAPEIVKERAEKWAEEEAAED